MRRPTLIAAATVSGVLLLTGASSCETPDCGSLPAPTSAQVQAAREVVRGEAVEVEVELENEVGTAECVVDSDTGGWVNVTDDAA